jgi:hypothetical protein
MIENLFAKDTNNQNFPIVKFENWLSGRNSNLCVVVVQSFENLFQIQQLEAPVVVHIMFYLVEPFVIEILRIT